MSEISVKEGKVELKIGYDNLKELTENLSLVARLVVSLSKMLKKDDPPVEKVKDSAFKAEEKKEAQETLRDAPLVEDVKVTLDDIKKKALTLMQKGKQAEVADLIVKYKANMISEIPKEKHEDFIKDLGAL